jgi:hypothetical protein
MAKVKPLAFCHIPKTGGTSVHRLLESWYPPEVITENIASESYSSAMLTWGRYRVVIGHFWFKPGEVLDAARHNITVLRDPVDRILSHYYFSVGLDSTLYPSAPERSLDLLSYVTSELPSVRATTRNFQTRLLAPLGLAPSSGNATDNELLAAAIRAVDMFDLVGVYPELDDAAACIAYLAGISVSRELPRENVTAGRPTIADIPGEVRRQLQRLNELDLELYSYAFTAFKKKRRQLLIAGINGNGAREPVESRTTVTDSTQPDGSRLEADRAAAQEVVRSTPTARFGTRAIEILRVTVSGDVSLGSNAQLCGENVTVTIRIAAHCSSDDLTVGLRLHDSTGRLVFGTNTWLSGRRICVAADSEFSVLFTFRNTLGIGTYTLDANLHTGKSHLDCCYDWFDKCAALNVVGVTGFHFEGSSSLSMMTQVATVAGDAPVWAEQQTHAPVVRLPRHNPRVTVALGRIHPIGSVERLRAGDVVSIEIELESRCDQTLESEGLRPLRVCYRWLHESTGAIIEKEGIRTNLAVDLRPGQVHRAWMTVAAPPGFFGRAILRLVPVQENVAWFDELGTFYHDMPVMICE